MPTPPTAPSSSSSATPPTRSTRLLALEAAIAAADRAPLVTRANAYGKALDIALELLRELVGGYQDLKRRLDQFEEQHPHG